MIERLPTLAEEARYLHDSLFSPIPIDPSIVTRYENAHHALFPGESPTSVTRIVARRLDVQAVEFSLRRRHSCPELTRKIQILCYLVEVRAPYQNFFIASRREPFHAVLSLSWCLLSTVWKGLKGEYLVRVHELL